MYSLVPSKKFLNLLTSATAVFFHVVSVLAAPIVAFGRARNSPVDFALAPTIAHVFVIWLDVSDEVLPSI